MVEEKHFECQEKRHINIPNYYCELLKFHLALIFLCLMLTDLHNFLVLIECKLFTPKYKMRLKILALKGLAHPKMKKLSESSQICVAKMNISLTGLEQHN